MWLVQVIAVASLGDASAEARRSLGATGLQEVAVLAVLVEVSCGVVLAEATAVSVVLHRLLCHR